MDSGSQRTAQFGLVKSVIFGVVLMTAFFFLTELGLRMYVYSFRSPAEVWDLGAGTFALRPGEHRRIGADPIVINSRGFVGLEFEDPRSDGTVRIVALGDSCTFGQATRDGHYPFLLERLLNQDAHEVRFQVINAGIEGLNSELALRRLRSKVVPLSPDLVTVYVGWNDLMKFDPAGQTEQPRLAIVARVLDRLWMVRGMRKLVFYHLRPRLMPPATGPASRTGRFAEYRPKVFETHLREIVATAEEAGARVALLTLPSVVSDDMTSEDLRRANVQFPYFPAAYGVGDFVDLIGAYNRTIRRVAVTEEVPLIDLALAMDERSDRRRLFSDTMHPNEEGRRVVAEVVARELSEAGILQAR